MRLKITDIKTATVLGNYYWTFVKVYAGEESGIGEGFFAPKLKGVIKEFGRTIIGENALDLGQVYEKMRWAAIPSGFHGTNLHAISALEIALLDLIGKHLNVPVYTLLGGKHRESIRVYVDAHAGEALEALDPVLLPMVPKWMQEIGFKITKPTAAPAHGRTGLEAFSDKFTPEAYTSKAKQMKDEGYTAIKFDLDVPTPYTRNHDRSAGFLTNREVQYLAGLVGSVRDTVGDAVDLLFDLHWVFNIESAIRLARAVEPYNIMWFEDPVPPSNPELLKFIADATKTPIATGENLYTRHEFSKAMNSNIRFITPDALKVGGLNETKFLSQMASMKEITTSPHNIASPIGTMAQVHLSASIPNFGVLEFHGHDTPIWRKLADKEIIKNGFITLTDESGLGIELDEHIASKCSLAEEFDL